MSKPFRDLSMPAAALVFISVFISGCATTGGGGGMTGGGGGTVGDIGYDYKERQIINQARATGTVIGAGAGYAIARNNSSSDASRIGGAMLGGLAGGLAGDAVGKAQANKAREKRLDNESLQRLVNEAHANNERLASYNRKVANRIAAIRKAEAGERAKQAKSELASVNRAIKQTDQMIEQNEADRTMLAGSQRGELDRENRKAKSERAVLASHRDELATLAAR